MLYYAKIRGKITRKAKIPDEEVDNLVLSSLTARMDPSTRRVKPQWDRLIKETRVCRQRISKSIKRLEERGIFRVVFETYPPNADGSGTTYYEFT